MQYYVFTKFRENIFKNPFGMRGVVREVARTYLGVVKALFKGADTGFFQGGGLHEFVKNRTPI